jgi:hypothetical protein
MTLLGNGAWRALSGHPVREICGDLFGIGTGREVSLTIQILSPQQVVGYHLIV